MKKHLSILGLFARQSLLPVLGILLLMCGMQAISFHFSLRDALVAYQADVGGGFPQLEVLLPHAAVYAYFALGFILITALLCLNGCQFRTKSGYTWRRLSVSEHTVFLWQWLYNMLIYLLLWLVQTVFTFALCRYYLTAAPEAVLGTQTLFLAFWRSEYLHALLPLADVTLWVRNGLLLISLGLAAAIFPYKQRRGRYSGSAIALIPYTLITFERGIGEWSHVGLALTVTALVLGEWISMRLLSDDEGEVSEDA
jgi:hypothetical protein